MSGVLVLGNATLDVVQRVDRLPAVGETRLGAAPLRCAGGKGLNQAVVAARTGARVDFVAAIGGDADGAALRGAVAGEGLRHADWRVVPAPTDLSTIWVDADGRNMIVSSCDCAAALAVADVEAAIARLTGGDWLVMQGNLTLETTRAAAIAARARGAGVAINAAPIAFDYAGLLPVCDLLLVNEVEATTLAGGGDARDAARRLATGRTVVLTLGEAGAVLIGRDGEQTVTAPRVTAIDTAGAGDVLAGTLIGLASQGTALASALRTAVLAASLSVTRAGTSTSFPSAEEIADLRAVPPR